MMGDSQISIYMAIIPALCVLAGVLGGILFYSEPMAVPKIIFILVILIGVVGLLLSSIR